MFPSSSSSRSPPVFSSPFYPCIPTVSNHIVRMTYLSKLHDVITHVSSHEQHRFILEGWIPGLTRRSVRPRTSVLLDPLQVLFIVGMDV